jgi:hypothetical protein
MSTTTTVQWQADCTHHARYDKQQNAVLVLAGIAVICPVVLCCVSAYLGCMLAAMPSMLQKDTSIHPS